MVSPPSAAPSLPRVLVVEDHPADLGLLRFALGAGYELVHVETAEAATHSLANRLPHAVLLDWMLPGDMQGIELLRFIRRRHEYRHLPVAMLSSHTDPMHMLEAHQLGASVYFSKPIKPARLVGWLQQVT